MLSVLIDSGSRYATNAMLYHYCTTTNQVKETSSKVDMGFHYVATDSTGIPLDNDSDNLGDYLEDSNGDGTYNAGDLADWTSSDTDGDGVSDYIELLQGRSPKISGTTNDSSGLINLRVYTPLK
jgi:hypothetical protein